VKEAAKRLTIVLLSIILVTNLYAQSRLAPPNDQQAVASKGQTELILNTENADKDIAVWLNGVIVAHIPPKRNEKMIINDGIYNLEAAETNFTKGQWAIGSRKKLIVNAVSSFITISFATRYGSLLNPTIQETKGIGSPVPDYHAATPASNTNNTSPVPTSNISSGDGSAAFSLENAVDRAAQEIVKEIPENATLAVLSIATNDLELYEFVIEELELRIFRSKRFTVVDRKRLNEVRGEIGFQMSGEVDEASAQSIGKWLGASYVIFGSISGTGATRRLRVRALEVETGVIVGMASEQY
jgi:TolB-like protein